MCRMLAYLGNEILLSKLLLEPEHSLEKQSWQPRLLREATLNADGYGFAWYNHTNSKVIAEYYRNILPIWNDPNLRALCSTISKPLWLAAVRSATPGLGTSLQNTQPFKHNQWTFFHNGYLLNFAGQIQHAIRDQLENEYLYLINGNTDSEYIFALLMQLLNKHNPEDAIQECFTILAHIMGDNRALLNLLFSDGESIYATKHAINGLCPSLFYATSSTEFGNDNQLLVSEPLNSESCWEEVQDNSIIKINQQQPAKTTPI